MKINFGQILIAIVLPIVIFSSCELVPPPDRLNLAEIATEDISYLDHVQPIFDQKCVKCHVGTDAGEGLRLDSWPNLVDGSVHGNAIIPFDADNSLMINMVTRLQGGPHPTDRSPNTRDTLRQDEIEFIGRWIDAGAKFDDGSIPYEDATQLLYVANQNDATVSIIDVESKNVIRNLDLLELPIDVTPNAKPHHVAVDADPAGDRWYVSLIGDNKILEFSNGPSVQPLYQRFFEFETPGLLAVNGSRDEVYVGRSLTAVTPPQSIGIINQADNSIREVDVLAPRPHALAVHPSGNYVHTGSLSESRILTLNPATDEVTFIFLANPNHTFIQFAASPSGDRMVVSGQTSDQIVILDTAAPPDIIRIGAIEVGNMPWHPVWTPDGSRVYVGNLGDNSVSVLDMNSGSILQTITGHGLAEPHGSAVSPDGQFVFISNRNTQGAYVPRYDFGNNHDKGTVVVINTGSNEIERVIEVGRFPAGLSTILP